MSDDIELSVGSGGATVRADDIAGIYYQIVKLDGGGNGLSVPILAGGGLEVGALRVTIASDSTGVLSIDDNGGTISIDDGASSITV